MQPLLSINFKRTAIKDVSFWFSLTNSVALFFPFILKFFAKMLGTIDMLRNVMVSKPAHIYFSKIYSQQMSCNYQELCFSLGLLPAFYVLTASAIQQLSFCIRSKAIKIDLKWRKKLAFLLMPVIFDFIPSSKASPFSLTIYIKITQFLM